jgi:NADH dehydrogenase
VIAGGERIEARTIVWAAGVMASKVGSWLDARTDRAGRVFVGADLTIPCDPDVYVIGDAANVMSPEGMPLPGTARSPSSKAPISRRRSLWSWRGRR